MLRLRTKASQAVFSWEDGPMKAQWELHPGMDEQEIMSVLASMARFIKAQPAGADVIEMPVRAVPDPLETSYGPALVEARQRREEQAPPPMTWKPAVQPKPLEDSLEAASQNGFELIPEGE